eukprot:gnl/MRDRNA2_/MRDRNA2_75747_c0_seq1.p1 gnl/MRDRNA2_/MRDRNA2_75747_c0~~gnl/MRDRNA2_/MRDRNA2_75747_c0_seq1.p1  ORF type:complete len:111 (-),score=3.69 gnl/MRDRNA2_/MRDRNA2_75747_c0_seq1:77-409(-)
MEHIDFNYSQYVSDRVVEAIANHCPRLRSIYVSESNITTDALVSLCRSCPGLEHVDMDQCRGIQTPGFLLLARACGSNVQALSVGGCPGVSDRVLEYLGSHCPIRLTLSI